MALFFVHGSAAQDRAGIDGASLKQFTVSVEPLLARHCIECHSGAKPKAKLDLTRIDGVLTGSRSGPVISPGRAKESLIYQVLQPGADPHMPPKKQLAADEIQKLVAWIDQLKPIKLASKEKTITEKDRAFWAFQPPRRAAIPRVKNEAWVRNPLDAFVLAKLEEQGVSPSPPASKLALIRRATFDLTGLPPTQEEVEAFLADKSPTSYESLIDRLLASPRYGERWGRHWLDLARYADSDGFEFDADRPYAYPYRDYVIKSFNDDKPYDRFILEQLAGDELEPGNIDCLVATGFCRNGPTIDNQKLEKNRLDELDDVLSTTSSVFLGLTVGCARCHDHKYDPIPQRDYYRMLAVFNSLDKKTAPLSKREPDQLAESEKLKRELESLSGPMMGPGKWRIEDGELVQESLLPNIRFFFGDRSWTDYNFEVEAMKVRGSEGFLLAFRAADLQNFFWVNFGGWANKLHGVECEIKGIRALVLERKRGSVETGRWHKLRVETRGRNFKCFLDGEQVFEFLDDRLPEGGVGFGAWATAMRYRNLRVTDPDGKLLWEGIPPLTQDALSESEQKTRAARVAELKRRIKALEAQAEGAKAQCIMDVGPKPRPTFFLVRGDHRIPAGEVQPGVLSVLARQPLSFPAAGSRTTGRRLALARWIANPDNPLTARVMVNRIWQYHFGRGIVESSSNFGTNGAEPTHPELLDWLATEFVGNSERGIRNAESNPNSAFRVPNSAGKPWSIKAMHKLIMTSATYRQASDFDAAKAKIDPDNRYLWRHPKRRLEAEAIRDTILFASGNLNLQMYGPGVKPRIDPGVIATGSTPKWPKVDREGPEHWRRSVYIFIKRSVLMPMMESFDAPTTTQSCERRLPTTVAPQALQLLNGQFTNEQAACMAQRLYREAGEDVNRQVERAFWLTVSRPPTDRQRRESLAFLEQQKRLHRSRPSSLSDPAHVQLAALTDLCHVLLNVNEFVYLD